jgi:8-oxo-dGTP pyrophosphatase MutT (NUDIX family)
VRWLSPSFTVGAICLIERPDGAWLLVKHIYRSDWGIPGGLLKRGEEPADAVRREVAEEIGLQVELVGEPVVVVEPKLQRVDLVFRARPRELAELESVRPRSPEIEQVRWFRPDELPRLQSETATALVALARSSASPQAMPLPSSDA